MVQKALFEMGAPKFLLMGSSRDPHATAAVAGRWPELALAKARVDGKLHANRCIGRDRQGKHLLALSSCMSSSEKAERAPSCVTSRLNGPAALGPSLPFGV